MRGGARAGLGAHHERRGAERDAEDVLRALRELRAREERGGEVDAAVEQEEEEDDHDDGDGHERLLQHPHVGDPREYRLSLIHI